MFIEKSSILANEIFKNEKNVENALSAYFVSENFLKYITYFENINKKQEEALKLLFNDFSELEERCNKVLEINSTCYEAYYILNFISDSLNFYYQSLDIQNIPFENYDDEYEKNDVINIKLLLSYFFSNINNYHQGLACLNEVEKIIGLENILTRKMVIYSFLEDYKSMEEVYNVTEFNDPSLYIEFIICLLKNNQNGRAVEIFDDMYSKYKYAEYLYKPQELDTIKNEEAEQMIKAVEMCFDLIESIPYFFSWVSDCVESKNQLPN